MNMDLNTLWFILVGVLLTGYAVLDGFDFGVGAHLVFAKKDEDRRIILNSIGPVWDGNEVWLLTGGGALFAAFPDVYATVFSGFYLAFILLLLMLIFRAVSIEFRGKVDSPVWKKIWDKAFWVSSIVVPLLLGVALGNVLRGVPMDAEGEYAGTFLFLLNPYSLLIGLFALSTFILHGSLYLLLKTEGELSNNIFKSALKKFWAFLLFYIAVIFITPLLYKHLVLNFSGNKILILLPLIHFAAIALLYVTLKKQKFGAAFFLSCFSIMLIMVMVGICMYPNLVNSYLEETRSLTIYNSASSQKTLGIMAVIAAIGMPLVLTYTFIIYRIFRGRVKLDTSSY